MTTAKKRVEFVLGSLAIAIAFLLIVHADSVHAQAVGNGDFKVPNVSGDPGGFVQDGDPALSGHGVLWNFPTSPGGDSGITVGGSAGYTKAPNAPDGDQMAWIENLGVIWQTVTLTSGQLRAFLQTGEGFLRLFPRQLRRYPGRAAHSGLDWHPDIPAIYARKHDKLRYGYDSAVQGRRDRSAKASIHRHGSRLQRQSRGSLRLYRRGFDQARSAQDYLGAVRYRSHQHHCSQGGAFRFGPGSNQGWFPKSVTRAFFERERIED